MTSSIAQAVQYARISQQPVPGYAGTSDLIPTRMEIPHDNTLPACIALHDEGKGVIPKIEYGIGRSIMIDKSDETRLLTDIGLSFSGQRHGKSVLQPTDHTM